MCPSSGRVAPGLLFHRNNQNPAGRDLGNIAFWFSALAAQNVADDHVLTPAGHAWLGGHSRYGWSE